MKLSHKTTLTSEQAVKCSLGMRPRSAVIQLTQRCARAYAQRCGARCAVGARRSRYNDCQIGETFSVWLWLELKVQVIKNILKCKKCNFVVKICACAARRRRSRLSVSQRTYWPCGVSRKHARPRWVGAGGGAGGDLMTVVNGSSARINRLHV